MFYGISNLVGYLMPNSVITHTHTHTHTHTNTKEIRFLIFTHELNKNNYISFLDVLIDTNNYNNNFTTSTYKKKTPITTPVPSTLKVNAPSDI